MDYIGIIYVRDPRDGSPIDTTLIADHHSEPGGVPLACSGDTLFSLLQWGSFLDSSLQVDGFLISGEHVRGPEFYPSRSYFTLTPGAPLAVMQGGFWLSGQDWDAEQEINHMSMLHIPGPDEPLSIGNLHQHILCPEAFTVSVYPNPFNSVTTLTLSLPGISDVEVDLYDVTGRYVRSVVRERMTAGEHTLRVEAAGLPSGIYFVKARAGEFAAVRKVVLVK